MNYIELLAHCAQVQALLGEIETMVKAWEEDAHPRGPDGKFGPGGGSKRERVRDAEKSSNRANELSQESHSNPAKHKEAADAHEEAASKHEKADRKGMANLHRSIAMEHKREAEKASQTKKKSAFGQPLNLPPDSHKYRRPDQVNPAMLRGPGVKKKTGPVDADGDGKVNEAKDKK